MPCLSGQERVRTYCSGAAAVLRTSFMTSHRLATPRPGLGRPHRPRRQRPPGCAAARPGPRRRSPPAARAPRGPRGRPPASRGGPGTRRPGRRPDLVHDPQHPQHGDVHERRLLRVPEDRADVLLGGPVVEPGVLDQAVHGVGDVPVPVDTGQPDVALERGVGEHVQRGAHIAAPAPPRHVVQWHAAHGGGATAATGRVLRTLHGHRSYVPSRKARHRPPALHLCVTASLTPGHARGSRCGGIVRVHDR